MKLPVEAWVRDVETVETDLVVETKLSVETTKKDQEAIVETNSNNFSPVETLTNSEVQIKQLKTSVEQWKSDYYELDLANQKLRNTYSLKFTEKVQQYLGDLVKKHIALTRKQHLASQQESQERDFLDDWTFKWFFREGGEEIFSNHD